jgi:hypothetical protein
MGAEVLSVAFGCFVWYSCKWINLTPGSYAMRSKILANARSLAILFSALALIGVLASMFIILVRVPALSSTKLEELFGTLQGMAVALLFSVLFLLVNLTYMVHRASLSRAGNNRIDE